MYIHPHSDRISRSGPTTLAQTEWWHRLYWRGRGEAEVSTWSRLWTLPPSTLVSDAESALTSLVEKHEILRTTFLLGPDNVPIQVVYKAGALRVPISVWSVQDVDELSVPKRLLQDPISHTLPWCATIYSDGRQARLLRLTFEHILTDGSGLINFFNQFLTFCSTNPPELPVIQPVERAWQERNRINKAASAGGDPPGDNSEKVAQLLAAPTETDRSGLSKNTGLRVRGFNTSTAHLFDEICASLGVTRAVLAMYLIASIFSVYSGEERVLCSSVIDTRFPSDGSIDCALQHIEVLVDTSRTKVFADALKALQVATLQAYGHGLRMGTHSKDARLRSLSARGAATFRPLYFNFLGHSSNPAPGEDYAQTAATLVESGIERPEWQTIVTVDERYDGLEIDFEVDYRQFPESIIKSFISAIPNLLMEIHKNPGKSLDDIEQEILAKRAPIQLTKVSGLSCDMESVRRRLLSHKEVDHANVSIRKSVLHAELWIKHRLDLLDIHEFMMEQAVSDMLILAPRTYQFHTSASPSPPLNQLSPIEAVDSIPALPPRTTAEIALCSAIGIVHDIIVEDIASTYGQVGGQIAMGPAVCESMRRAGFTGLKRDHFRTPTTLRSIARDIHPI